MKINFFPYVLELRHTFAIAVGSRAVTPAVIVTLEEDGITGYGEASMPPYLGETPDTASAFLSLINMDRHKDPFLIDTILHDVDMISPGNPAAKAAFDIALHDWVGKKIGYPWFRIWGLDRAKIPATSFTIGMAEKEVVRKMAQEAAGYKVLKVKLGGKHDKEMIETIREVTGTTIRVDVNQGWDDKSHALAMSEWLARRNVESIEQPLPRESIDDTAWLRERSPIPIIGDESIQRIADIQKAFGVFDGVNVKLMKATGMREAYGMMILARSLGMKVMIGCMTETSCAISAAAQLSPLADWADLDGAALIQNDPFDGAKIINGRVIPADRPGIGAVPLKSL
jgi:L-alanine-DL-glutamate epimerase-like enolase superfamily enzyme